MRSWKEIAPPAVACVDLPNCYDVLNQLNLINAAFAFMYFQQWTSQL